MSSWSECIRAASGFQDVVIDATMGLRVRAEDEVSGLDRSQHAESAYGFTREYSVWTAEKETEKSS